MLIDTHCHLVDEFVNPTDVPGVIERAHNAGVEYIIVPGAEPDDAPKQMELLNTYDNLFATMGIHPEHANDAPYKLYEQYLSHSRVVGIGEIGLDYHYGVECKAAQIELFERQLNIALQTGLPVAIHVRDAEPDAAAILTRPEYDAIGGVMHCFTGTWDFAKKMLDRGFFFSAGGIITFKNADDLRDVFAKIPMDRIVIETDAPFLAPVPYRGKKCEPFMITETARALAAVKGVDVCDLKDILIENTKRLYPKIKI